jgi:hypothetical protein
MFNGIAWADVAALPFGGDETKTQGKKYRNPEET